MELWCTSGYVNTAVKLVLSEVTFTLWMMGLGVLFHMPLLPTILYWLLWVCRTSDGTGWSEWAASIPVYMWWSGKDATPQCRWSVACTYFCSIRSTTWWLVSGFVLWQGALHLYVRNYGIAKGCCDYTYTVGSVKCHVRLQRSGVTCVWGGVTGLLASEAICIKCIVHSITDLEGPEMKQRCSSSCSLILVLAGCGWLMPYPAHFIPGKETW